MDASWTAGWSMRQYVLTAAGIVLVTAVVLFLMGQPPICTCGYVKAWHGVVLSSENSQHLSDWYTFSHVIHGFVFYAVLWLAASAWPLGPRFVAAVGLECIWELVENTDFVINRYRTATISLDYYGDSVLNSISDILAMMAGFGVASAIPPWVTLTLAVGLESFLAFFIRDNLTLNVIMLLHPIESIRRWQSGA